MAAKKATQKKLTEPTALVSTRKYIELIDRFYWLMHPLGLERFRNEHILALMGAKPYIDNGPAMPPAIQAAILREPLPHTSCVARDEEASQVAGDSILADWLRITHEGFGDHAHRVHNDVNNQLKRHGFWVFQLAGTIIMNIARGPWESSSFFRQLLSHASTDMKHLDPDGPTVMHFWQRILRDRGQLRECSQEIRGAPARAKLVSDLGQRPAQLMHGDRVSGKSFFSIHKAAAFWMPIYNELALVITHLCITKGMVLHGVVPVHYYCTDYKLVQRHLF